MLYEPCNVLLVFDDKNPRPPCFRQYHHLTVVNGRFRAVTRALNVGYRCDGDARGAKGAKWCEKGGDAGNARLARRSEDAANFGDESGGRAGLRHEPVASGARGTLQLARPSCAVSATTGMCDVRVSFLRRRVASHPSMTGKLRSIRTTSGECDVVCVIASTPFPASMTSKPDSIKLFRVHLAQVGLVFDE